MIMKGQAEEGHRRKTGGKESSMSELKSENSHTVFGPVSHTVWEPQLLRAAWEGWRPHLESHPGPFHTNIFFPEKLYLIQWDYAVNKSSNLWNVYGSNISLICLQLLKAHENKLNVLSLHTTAWIEEIKNKVKWNNLWKSKWNYTKLGRKSSVCSGFFIFMNTTVF